MIFQTFFYSVSSHVQLIKPMVSFIYPKGENSYVFSGRWDQAALVLNIGRMESWSLVLHVWKVHCGNVKILLNVTFYIFQLSRLPY